MADLTVKLTSEEAAVLAQLVKSSTTRSVIPETCLHWRGVRMPQDFAKASLGMLTIRLRSVQCTECAKRNECDRLKRNAMIRNGCVEARLA
jgi:hypothetical protein